MQPQDFAGSNYVFKAPPDMTEEECGDLPVYATRDNELESSVFISCWRPSWRERLSLLFFGRVWLEVYSHGQPPVAIWAGKELFANLPPVKTRLSLIGRLRGMGDVLLEMLAGVSIEHDDPDVL